MKKAESKAPEHFQAKIYQPTGIPKSTISEVWLGRSRLVGR
jgi:hypothetical protein